MVLISLQIVLVHLLLNICHVTVLSHLTMVLHLPVKHLAVQLLLVTALLFYEVVGVFCLFLEAPELFLLLLREVRTYAFVSDVQGFFERLSRFFIVLDVYLVYACLRRHLHIYSISLLLSLLLHRRARVMIKQTLLLLLLLVKCIVVLHIDFLLDPFKMNVPLGQLPSLY